MKISLPFNVLMIPKLFFTSNLNNPVLEFRNKLEYLFKSYDNNPGVEVKKLSGGWVKEYYRIEGNYSYDVQKTKSLVSLYKGICEFIIIRSFTDHHKSKEAAESDNDFSNSCEISHRHIYLYQNGKWVVSERKNKSNYTSWYDCNEAITLGENENSTNIQGCWDNNF
ncbi:MAG TPA: hypothetical protein VLN72_08620 [Gillisia sp.]|nr:hypothetical protein [Gillisia sp.]